MSGENWNLYPHAGRIELLRTLRSIDPAAVPALLAAQLPSEPAPVRLMHLAILREFPGEYDAPCLEAFARDRSDKVKALVTLLLARIGRTKGKADAAGELAQLLEKRMTGLIKKSPSITPKACKNKTQQEHRDNLLAGVAFKALSEALGASEPDMIDAWQFNEDLFADIAFARCVSRTAPDDVADRFADRCISLRNGAIPLLQEIIERLSTHKRLEAELPAIFDGILVSEPCGSKKASPFRVMER